MKLQPCRRHQPVSQGYIVDVIQRADGPTLARFAVTQHTECARCAARDQRVLGTPRAVDGWEAARLSGVPEAEMAMVNIRGGEPVQQAESGPAVIRPLKCWPFPVSTFYPSAQPRR